MALHLLIACTNAPSLVLQMHRKRAAKALAARASVDIVMCIKAPVATTLSEPPMSETTRPPDNRPTSSRSYATSKQKLADKHDNCN